MIRFVLKQNKNKKSAAYNKYYAFPVIDETIDLEGLAEHMASHSTPFSKATTLGVLTEMVGCIKEMLLAGYSVKINDLAIFSVGIRNKQGAASEEDFTVSSNISGVKLRARATGTLSTANLNLAATVRKATALTASSTSSSSGSDSGSSSSSNTGGTTTTTTKKTVTLSVSPTNGGTVTGDGEYESGATATLTATANSGYTFLRWSDGNTSASRSVTVSDDLSLTAVFNSTSSGGSGLNA